MLLTPSVNTVSVLCSATHCKIVLCIHAGLSSTYCTFGQLTWCQPCWLSCFVETPVNTSAFHPWLWVSPLLLLVSVCLCLWLFGISLPRQRWRSLPVYLSADSIDSDTLTCSPALLLWVLPVLTYLLTLWFLIWNSSPSSNGCVWKGGYTLLKASIYNALWTYLQCVTMHI